MHWMLLYCLGLFALLPVVLARYPEMGCRVQPNVTMVPDVLAALAQYGSASALAAGITQPWPEVERKGRKLRVVKYCYSNSAERDRLDCPGMAQAFDRWQKLLKSPEFDGTTNLAWEELHDGNPDRSKRKPFYCLDSNNQWDFKNVPGDTLRIAFDDAVGGPIASIGYDASRPKDAWGYHYLLLHKAQIIDPDIIAHELGHVFGMSHEHQRHDRDDHLHYDCTKLRDYDDTIAKVRVENKINYEVAHLNLCENRKFADSYNFPSGEFMKDTEGRVHDDPGMPFDIDSIMIYPSRAFANDKCLDDMNACPLLQYGRFGGIPNKNLPMSRIPHNVKPSTGDIKWVQKWYPSSP